MKKTHPVNKEESLKDNIKHILPLMFDDFFFFKESAVNFPLRRNLLHRMRIAGKPLRYAMEIGEYCFGDEFKQCLGEVKDVIELMGEIHDADVIIPEVNLHIKEIRLFNQTIPDFKQRLSTKTPRDLVEGQRSLRRKMYAELCQKLNNWQTSGFKNRLTASMSNLS